ncbi:hypothetical protein F5X68DRAFT_238771 [Plectosphaerella plurivora]|uniref:Uncharacterized protein n=1 Tax=Plectosphaerella plurivora TaxID=936078 RepID=A0A9P9AIG3_9PEZI|nr:hypothetical protein F5X68DRAFT_238771 [Plectosphaerella plurivora]
MEQTTSQLTGSSKLESVRDLSDPLDDPTRPSLAAFADAGHPFSVPVSGDPRGILCGFDSSLMTSPKEPWLDSSTSPFDLGSRATYDITEKNRLKIILPDTRGFSASYRDGFSTTAGSTDEHLSAEVGVTVGYPFLNASATGNYDRAVMSSENSIRSSRNASCATGRVVLDVVPPFSPDTILLLRGSRDGPSRFRAKYGDYYICGYELGGNAGACMSGSTTSTSTTDTLTLTVTVRALFSEASTSTSESWTSCSAGSKLSLSGFSSISGSLEAEELVMGGGPGDEQRAQAIREASARGLAAVADLPSVVQEKMDQLGLKDGQVMALDAAEGVCRSGLVIKVLLAPFARLNQYVGLVNQPPLDVMMDDASGNVLGDPRMAAAARLFLSA